MKIHLLIVLSFTFLILHSSAQQTETDSITFEIPSEILFPIDSGSLWQVGTPAKTIFSQAHSLSKAIVTDTVLPYPVNDTSSFVLSFPFPVYPLQLDFSFWHKYNTDSIADKGRIEVSFNKGVNWYELTNYAFDSIIPDGEAYWTNGNIINDTLSVTGNSNGWELANYYFGLCFVAKQELSGWQLFDTLQFRFTFLSDSIESGKEGWMIDDIQLTGYYGDCCCGFDELQKKDFKIYPNPFNRETNIIFDTPVNNLLLRLQNIQGQLVYEKQFKTCNMTTLDFSKHEPGIYIIESFHDGTASRARIIIE